MEPTKTLRQKYPSLQTPLKLKRSKSDYSTSLMETQNNDSYLNSKINQKDYDDKQPFTLTLPRDHLAKPFTLLDQDQTNDEKSQLKDTCYVEKCIENRGQQYVKEKADREDSKRIVIRKHQFPEQVVKKYKRQMGRKKGGVNFCQGYLKQVGYLYYAIEKELTLINPNPHIFHYLSEKPIAIEMADTITSIYETNIKVRLQISNKHTYAKLAIVVYPWCLQLYALISNEKHNPFYKLYIKYGIQCENVIDLVVSTNGTIHYIGSDNIIHTLSINNSQLHNNSRFRIVDSLKKQKYKHKGNTIYQRIVNKIRRNIVQIVSKLTPYEHHVKLGIAKDNLYVLQKKWSTDKEKSQTKIVMKVQGKSKCISQDTIYHNTGLKGRIVNFRCVQLQQGNRVMLLLENGQCICWNHEQEKVQVIYNNHQQHTIVSSLLKHNKDEVQFMYVSENGIKGRLQQCRVQIGSVDKQIHKHENYLYSFSSQSSPYYFIHSTDTSYTQIIIFRDVDIIYDQIQCNDAVMKAISIQQHLLSSIQHIINIHSHTYLLRKMFYMYSHQQAQYYQNSNNHTIVFTQINHQQSKTILKLIKYIINKVQTDNPAFLKRIKSQVQGVQLQNYQLLSYHLQAVPKQHFIWIWLFSQHLHHLFHPLWSSNCLPTSNQYKYLLQQLKNIQNYIKQFSKYLKAKLTPFLTKMTSYLHLLLYLPEKNFRFGIGFNEDSQFYEERMFKLYTEEYEQDLLQQWRTIFPIYLSEKLINMCVLYKTVCPLSKIKVLQKLKTHETQSFLPSFLHYLLTAKNISKTQINQSIEAHKQQKAYKNGSRIQ